MYMYVHIYICLYTCIYTHVYIYMYLNFFPYKYAKRFDVYITDSDDIQEHFHKNFGPVATVKTAQEKFRKYTYACTGVRA